eukprot:scaffold28052_cov160-Skeletonema_menzelii.AAC.4
MAAVKSFRPARKKVETLAGSSALESDERGLSGEKLNLSISHSDRKYEGLQFKVNTIGSAVVVASLSLLYHQLFTMVLLDLAVLLREREMKASNAMTDAINVPPDELKTSPASAFSFFHFSTTSKLNSSHHK